MCIVPRRVASFLAAIAVSVTANALPVFNEIMFHPQGAPEVEAEEWLEIYNPEATPVNVSGWKITAGVSFEFPSGTTIGPGGYLVVAANQAAFTTAHPGFAGSMVGGWTGRLSNGGEKLELSDNFGNVIDEVSYADEGDWAMRVRGPLILQHRGWIWECLADGSGRTLELRNPALLRTCGQNWAVSNAAGGTPGAVNSVRSTNIAPLILDVRHTPEIPNSTQAITVKCRLDDDSAPPVATLFWRVGTGAFLTAAMSDTDGDGEVEGVIPPRTNLSVIEFYVSASDGTFTSTWPSPARTSDAGVNPVVMAQAANGLIQVDNSYASTINTDFTLPANQPVYRMIMTEAERQELAQIGSTSAQAQAEAEMNATFISFDGTGLEIRYRCGLGNRGFSSALGPPNNYHLKVPRDQLWNDRSGFQLNCRYPHSQTLGAALFARAGIAPQEAALVRVRINGTDLALQTFSMYGRYARVESLNGEWIERHFPDDSNGNLYRLDDHAPGAVGVPAGNLGSGEFRYEGENPAAYSDTFFRQTNTDDPSWSDLIEFCRVVSAPATGGTASQPEISDAAYPGAVGAKLDIDQFYTMIAADTLIGNNEGGLQSGRTDDFSIYRGVADQRFVFAPHDLDDIFTMGAEVGDSTTRSIFSYDTTGGGLLGLRRMFSHPQLVPRYYAKVLQSMDDWFNIETVGPIVDQIMGGWVPATDTNTTQATSIASIKAFVNQRRASVLSQIQQNYSATVTTTAPDVDGVKTTTDGAAVVSGTFNVAKTYSVTVNGSLAQWFYRSVGADAAGTWKMVVPAGANFLRPGLNRLVVRFWDSPNGAGNILQEYVLDVLNSASGQTVSGTLQPNGSVSMVAPARYVPGVPILVRVDLKNSAGDLDRLAWTRTATLTASNGVAISPTTIPVYNGMGSALVDIGGGVVTQDVLVARGGTAQSPTANPAIWRYLDAGAPPIATWKSDPNFTDASWGSGPPELGGGDGDERTVVANTSAGRRTWYFRHKFNVADPNQYTDLTIRMVYDDGIAVYLNGSELKRLNLAAGAADGDPATSSRTPPLESAIETYVVPKDALIAGENLLAVEVHNHTTTTDVSFDLELAGNRPANNPGDFTLTATVAGLSTAKAVISLAGQSVTDVSGALPAGTTTWSGVVHVTGDVTVPNGSTLNIDPGTVVLMDGTTGAGDTTGKRIVVNGSLSANGTAADVIQITSSDPQARWGQIAFANAQPSQLNYTLLSHAGHTTGVGHTGRGPMIRLTASNLSINDSVISDGPAKALYSSGTCDVVVRRSLITRMITGPELEDGISFDVADSNIQLILPDFRESNANAPDDEDCLYIHNAIGRPVTVRRCAFVRCGDDVFDCLAGPILVEDTILREGWDKGMSLLNNDLTITRSLIVDCDKGIVPKSSTAATRTANVDRCTIVCDDHDTSQAPWGYPVAPSDADPDTPSTAIYTQNKSGQSNPGATLAITVSNSILSGKEPVKVDAPYSAANTIVTYSRTYDVDTPGASTWPGTGNAEGDPGFASAATRDFHLASTSPCRDAGNPAQSDPDGSRVDMGALPYGQDQSGGSTLTWSPAGGPYHVTGNIEVPPNLTLVIQGGTSVYFEQNRRLTVNGVIKIMGTADSRVVFSGPPGAALADDPIIPGTQAVPPKWGGVRITNSMSPENIIAYADFRNAQGTDPATDNFGSIGVINSQCLIDHCTFGGTHLRMVYGSNSSITVQWCEFPDMFAEGEDPVAMGLDNVAEQLKLVGLAPAGGHVRVYHNVFGGNKGHNDVMDADSGRWGVSPVLDCRYNTFNGLTGDEHVDLGGDAYIASNVFRRGTKDIYTSDRGYSNAISSGDLGTGTTIMVARNTFFDVDHAVNLKMNTGAIFEHNTVADFHGDYHYSVGSITQDVACGAINLFIPEDVNPTTGDGAYAGYNLFRNIPRVFVHADLPTPNTNSKVEAFENYLDELPDLTVGSKHAGGLLSLGTGNVQPGDPLFVSPMTGDYTLETESPAKGAAKGGLDYGATIAEWAYLLDVPEAVTAFSTATIKVGGPGIVAFKSRLDGGAWSAPVQIGAGGNFPRVAATVRTGAISLSNLANGPHTLDVLGCDFAGNWQPEDSPTAASWTVNTNTAVVVINEVRASSPTLPDAIEIRNMGGGSANLTGWTLTDDPAVPNKYSFPNGFMLASGTFAALTSEATGLNLDKDGDAVYLYQNGTLRDSIVFGHQLDDMSIGRVGPAGEWRLCTPTFPGPNIPVKLGDPTSVRINEWFTGGDVLYHDDWIELANLSSLPIDIAGLMLSDNRGGRPEVHTMPALSFIAANGYIKLIADKNETAGGSHLNFALDAQQENIVLLAPGGRLIDTVALYPQATDRSMVRNAASASGFSSRELPTAGFEIPTTDPVYLNALAILRSLRITQIMYNAIGGSDFDWLELKNVGGTAFDLKDVEFIEGIAFKFGPLNLGPGQTVILVKNTAKFVSRYGNLPSVAGEYTGNLDNGGERLAIRLAPPFDESILDFKYSDEWYASTDGQGRGLTILNQLAKANTWSTRASWGASALGGTPGGVLPRTDTYNGWTGFWGVLAATDDNDRDGVRALVEFGLGMNPNSPNGYDGRSGAPSVVSGPNGRLALSFLLPNNVAAVGGYGMPEATYRVRASSDFLSWTTIATKTSGAGWSGTASVSAGTPGGGYTQIVVEDSVPFSANPRRFLKLEVVLPQ